MRLTYEIAADDRQIRRTLRGVEQEARAANRRMARDAQGGATAQARRASVSTVVRSEEAAARQAEAYWRRAHQRSVDTRIRNEQKAHDARLRQIDREERAQRRAIEATSRQRTRESERAEKRAQALRERTGARIGAGAARSVAGGVGTVARIGGASLALAGGFAAAGALSDQVEINRRASQLANAAGRPEIKGKIAEEARAVVGFSGPEAIGALQGFVAKTGNLEAGRAALQGLGKIALANGADLTEMGAAAGQAFNVIRDTITDPIEQLKALDEVMRTLTAQGNLGAVEIRDMTTELAGLGAATRSFQGGPVELLKTVGAMAQTAVARGGAESAAEATTSVVRFASDLTKRPGQKALAGLGIEAFADKGKTQLRSPQELMADILEKTKGDLTKVGAIFGEYGVRAVRGFSPLFTEAEKKKKGSGRAAVMAEFSRFTDANLSEDLLNRQFASRTADADVQFIEASKQFNAAIGRDILPVATKFTATFAQAIPTIARGTAALARFAEFLIDNPIKGIGAIIALSVAKDIASAGITSLMENAFSSAAANPGGIKVAGSMMIAAASVALAVDQWGKLTQQTGGTGGITAGLKSLAEGRGFFAGVDEFLNSKAKRDAPPPGAPLPRGGFATAAPAGTVLGKQADGQVVTKAQFESASPANQAEFLRTAAELTAAGKALKEAADAIKKSGGTEASRVAPIVSPSRG